MKKNIDQLKPETEVQTVRRIAGMSYKQIYLLIKKVTVISAYLENKVVSCYTAFDKDNKPFRKYTYQKVITAIYPNGRFSFPIHNVCENEEHNDELQIIFYNILGMPVPGFSLTIKQKIAA